MSFVPTLCVETHQSPTELASVVHGDFALPIFTGIFSFVVTWIVAFLVQNPRKPPGQAQWGALSSELSLSAGLFDLFSRLLADAVGGDVHSQMTFQFDVLAWHRAGDQQQFIDDEPT